jgi:hypothetical protein
MVFGVSSCCGVLGVSRWFWYALQIIIVVGVGGAGIHYDWSPNGYMIALIALAAAFGTTWILSHLLWMVGRVSAMFGGRREAPGDQAVENRLRLSRSGGGAGELPEQPRRLRVGHDPR